ncbi:MAG: VOC family protein [Gammaproteobacteria bacterium]
MRAEQIDQVTLSVKDLEQSVEFFGDMLGITFAEPIEAEVGGRKVRFAFSNIGIGLAQEEPPGEEGVRALGLKVDDVDGLKAKMDALGMEPLNHIQEPLKEVQYRIGGVRFNFGEYQGAPVPNRALSLLLKRMDLI